MTIITIGNSVENDNVVVNKAVSGRKSDQEKETMKGKAEGRRSGRRRKDSLEDVWKSP